MRNTTIHLFILPSLVAMIFASLSCRSEIRHGEPTGSDEVSIVGGVGRQPGYFVKPRAVALTKDNRLVVVDRSGRIQLFNSETGEFLSKWMLPESSNGTPTGITLDQADDTLWVADTHYQRILHYDLEGNLIWKFGEYGTDPGEMIFPTDVCPDPEDGSLWVCEYGLRSRVMHFDSDGNFLKEWGSSEYEYSALYRPMAISVDNEGRVYVVDGGNHRVLIYNKDGEIIDSWGEAGEEPGQLKYPYDLAIDVEGMLYICEYGSSRVSRFTPDGEYLGSFGVPGHKAGEFFSPWGVAAGAKGVLAVADTNNGRIQLVENPLKVFKKETAG